MKIGPRDLAAKQVKMVRRDTGTISDSIILNFFIYSVVHLFIYACILNSVAFCIILLLFYILSLFRTQEMCLIFSFLSRTVHDTGEKIDINVADAGTIVPALLVTIQSDMFIKAKAGRDEKMATVLKWEDFVPALEKDCLVLTPFCDEAEWEEKVKVCFASL